MSKRFAGVAWLTLGSIVAGLGCSSESDAKREVTPSDAPRTISPQTPPPPESAPIPVAAENASVETPGAAPPEAPLARAVVIDEVAIYQGTRVVLARAGQPVAASSRPMPIVAGRDALMRVFVSPKAGAGAQSVTAELFVVSHGKVLSAHKATATVDARSSETDVASTFNMSIPGAALTADSEFLVRLVTQGAPSVSTTTPHPAQYPTNGATARFDAKVSGTLKVVVVPIIYAADGSNRPPDVSAAVLDTARKRMLEFYPVANVDLRVRQPLVWNQPILASGTGWDEVLDRVTELRLTDNAGFDVYYYGVFAPAPSLAAYCPANCLLGLSNFAEDVGDAAYRSSVGALYAAMDAIDTMPHEIGHAHGRDHAPCGGASSPDPKFPYPGGRSGAWGYSVVTHQLQPPTLYDQMSYCAPAWQSDYTYRALFDRAHALANMRVATPEHGQDVARAISGEKNGNANARTYRMLRILGDGTIKWASGPFKTSVPVAGVGRAQAVSFVDESGHVAYEAMAHGASYDHLPGGVLLVPYDAPQKFARVRLDLSRIDSHPALAPLRARGLHVEVAK